MKNSIVVFALLALVLVGCSSNRNAQEEQQVSSTPTPAIETRPVTEADKAQEEQLAQTRRTYMIKELSDKWEQIVSGKPDWKAELRNQQLCLAFNRYK